METSRKIAITIIGILAITLLIISAFLKPAIKPNGCAPKIETRIIRGTSMQPLFKEGAEVKIDFNYYNCKKPQTGEIVIYQYSPDKNPIIKGIKGVAGDTIELKPTADKWNIIINSQILRNSAGQEYAIDRKGYNLLSLYIKDYGNKIPTNSFLIMGDQAQGTFDSSMLGLVGTQGLLGKVIK